MAVRVLQLFGKGAADVDQWRLDNARYLARLEERYPSLHADVEKAATAARAAKL